MSFERACALSDVPEDEALAVTLGAQDVAVARHGDEVFAVEDVCSHANVPLSEGEVATLLARTAEVALRGEFEPFKTSSIFDATAQHPEWLGEEPERLQKLMPT